LHFLIGNVVISSSFSQRVRPLLWGRPTWHLMRLNLEWHQGSPNGWPPPDPDGLQETAEKRDLLLALLPMASAGGLIAYHNHGSKFHVPPSALRRKACMNFYRHWSFYQERVSVSSAQIFSSPGLFRGVFHRSSASLLEFSDPVSRLSWGTRPGQVRGRPRHSRLCSANKTGHTTIYSVGLQTVAAVLICNPCCSLFHYKGKFLSPFQSSLRVRVGVSPAIGTHFVHVFTRLSHLSWRTLSNTSSIYILKNAYT
jgi:hypothetical protein